MNRAARPWTRWGVALTASTLVLAACGSEDATSGEESSEQPTEHSVGGTTPAGGGAPTEEATGEPTEEESPTGATSDEPTQEPTDDATGGATSGGTEREKRTLDGDLTDVPYTVPSGFEDVDGDVTPSEDQCTQGEAGEPYACIEVVAPDVASDTTSIVLWYGYDAEGKATERTIQFYASEGGEHRGAEAEWHPAADATPPCESHELMNIGTLAWDEKGTGCEGGDITESWKVDESNPERGLVPETSE